MYNDSTNLPNVVTDQMKKTFRYISFRELGSCEKRKQNMYNQVIAFRRVIRFRMVMLAQAVFGLPILF